MHSGDSRGGRNRSGHAAAERWLTVDYNKMG